jgi:predicted amidohydrolase
MDMKIDVVQFCPKLFDKEANLEKINDIITSSDADLIVLPELSTTGYFFTSREETEKYAEPISGDTYSSWQKIAEEKNIIIVAGFAEKAEDKVFNSAAVVFPDKEYSSVYRKTHLFYKERFCFDRGDTGFEVIEYEEKDLRLGTMICYDWRFPEAARTLALKGADLIVSPSNLVTDVWHISTPSRALENKVYFAVANRIGTETRDEEELYFNGMSAIYSYNGKQISKAGEKSEEIISAEIDPKATRNKSFNEFNDIFSDRQPDLYWQD